jgi:hypothetical protein
MVIFHSYVSLPEGKSRFGITNHYTSKYPIEVSCGYAVGLSGVVTQISSLREESITMEDAVLLRRAAVLQRSFASDWFNRPCRPLVDASVPSAIR